MTEVAGIEKVGGSVDTDLYLQVQNAFDEEKECEHVSHQTNKEHHDHGPAKWYIQIICPQCENVNQLRAVCDKWARLALSGYRIKCVSGARPCGVTSTDWGIVVCTLIRQGQA